MGFDHNWKYKTLENLEKDIWQFNPEEATELVKECNALRKSNLALLRRTDNDFTKNWIEIFNPSCIR
jgi:hypothetical protein